MKGEAQIELTISNCAENDKDIIIALLAGIGFDGFEESGDCLKAYTAKDNYDADETNEITERFSLSYDVKEVEPQNWNAVWESHFEPVVVDDFVAIRAHFHKPVQHVKHEILITPKMSFGTGHHATTTLMMQQMRDINFSGKDVFDFGTGTGVLAILAEKLGAKNIIAIDNDDWSIENSRENIDRNHCRNITIRLADSAVSEDSFDIILANINRNVILENLVAVCNCLRGRGSLVISGLLIEDEFMILQEATKYPLIHRNTRQLGQWISLLFSR